MTSDRAPRPPYVKAALVALLPIPVFLAAACSQAPADNTAEWQAKLAAAEARAASAERRAKSAEDAAGQHYQATIAASSPGQTENSQPDSQFGQPVIDTAPIVTTPGAAAPQQQLPPPGTLTN